MQFSHSYKLTPFLKTILTRFSKVQPFIAKYTTTFCQQSGSGIYFLYNIAFFKGRFFVPVFLNSMD